jgi:hypothetical protein
MKFRIATEEDIIKIWEFFKIYQFTEENITVNEFIKFSKSMYFHNPSSKHYQIVTEEDDQIIAHEAVIPLQYNFYDKELTLGLGSNTLIHEKHRQMLLFLQMQSYFFKNYLQYKINFTYGLVTRQDVLKVHLKTGYKKIGDVYVYARPYKVKKILNKTFKNIIIQIFSTFISPFADLFLSFFIGSLGDIKVKEEKLFKSDWDSILEKHNKQFKISGIRNSKILNWRFNTLDYRNYILFAAYDKNEYKGYVVIRKMKMQEFSSLAIVDLLCDKEDKNTFNSIIKKVHEYALEQKVDLVSTILSPHSSYLSLFKSKLFIKTPEFFTLVADQPKPSDLNISAELFKDWHINWFDHDFV